MYAVYIIGIMGIIIIIDRYCIVSWALPWIDTTRLEWGHGDNNFDGDKYCNESGDDMTAMINEAGLWIASYLFDNGSKLNVVRTVNMESSG